MSERLTDSFLGLFSQGIWVTHAAALAVWPMIARGDERAADQRAVDAMRRALNSCPFQGTVVVGEGERDSAPLLYCGEKVGTGWCVPDLPCVDVAVDPLEGTALAARGAAGALSVAAFSPSGGLLKTPDVYMEKIATGPHVPPAVVHLDAPIEENLSHLADAKGCRVADLRVCILDRPRHQNLIERIRVLGCRVFLITDGDVTAIILTALERASFDLYIGTGGAPEGVLAAAALRCLGGWMQGRLCFQNPAERARAKECGLVDLDRLYDLQDLASGDVFFYATGITSGSFLRGLQADGDTLLAHSCVMEAPSGIISYIETAAPVPSG